MKLAAIPQGFAVTGPILRASRYRTFPHRWAF